MMLLHYLTSIFIDVFGITHPSTGNRDQATQYIAFLILVMIVGLLLV